MKIKSNESLKKYSGYGCGGPAKKLIEIKDCDEVLKAFEELEKNESWFLLGCGYNTLISDNGYNGTVFRLGGKLAEVRFEESEVFCGGGAVLSSVLGKCAKRSLAGMEFLAGIPGTVGAAVSGNAGSAVKGIGEIVKKVKIYNARKNKIQVVDSSQIDFAYRDSSLKSHEIVLGAVLGLKKGSAAEIINKTKKNLKLKAQKQPLKYKSCGCVFKNPSDNVSAGRLIEGAGLSGLISGDARVSAIHANYIVNTGKAGSAEIWDLIKKVRNTVKEKFNVELELEIKLLGDDFE